MEMKDFGETYSVPDEAQRYSRYEIGVWQLIDGSWVARPVDWPMLEARSTSRSVAVLGCLNMIDAEYERDGPKPSLERRDYGGQTATTTNNVLQKTWLVLQSPNQ